MQFKYLILVLLFFIAAITQASLAQYFSIKGISLNLIFILFFIIIFFEDKKIYEIGFFASIMAGFFTGSFSYYSYIIAIASFLLVYFLEKKSANLINEWQEESAIFYFIPIFLACFFAYSLIFYALSILFNVYFNFIIGYNTMISLAYNLVVACIGFYIYIKIFKKERQLKLIK